MRVGVKILDDARFRKVLDEGFEQFGYSLANSDVDEQLYCAHYSHLTPQGRGRAYLLKFTRRIEGDEGDWDTVALLEASTNKELNRTALNRSALDRSVDETTFLGGGQQTQEEVDRAYLRWVEQILAMCISEMNAG